jgi:hypothetical protein
MKFGQLFGAIDQVLGAIDLENRPTTLKKFDDLEVGDMFLFLGKGENSGSANVVYMKTTNCCSDNTAVELKSGQCWTFHRQGEVRAL